MRFLSALIPLLMNGLMSLFGRIISALGLTLVSYIGLEALISQFKQHISTSITGAPAQFLQMFYLSGGGAVLNIFFGCFAFVLSFKTLSKIVPKKG